MLVNSRAHSGYDIAGAEALETPLSFLMRASRTYVWHAGRDCVVPDSLRSTFALTGLSAAYDALQRTFDRLLAAATSDIVLHAPGCPAKSELEQAFILAIRCLQREDSFGYTVTVAAVAPPAVIRRVRPDMVTLADMLTDAERIQPGQADERSPHPDSASRHTSRLRH